jgi:hypothetical protein
MHSSTVYGTVVYDGKVYVKFDGSELLTPVSTTVNVADGDRVAVEIQNHTATITGNITDPSAGGNSLAYTVSGEEINATKDVIDNLRLELANIGKLEVVEAEIETLEAKYANLDKVKAEDVQALNAEIEKLEAKFAEFDDVEVDDLEALNADINQLKAYNADFTYVSADNLHATKSEIDNLDVGGLTVEQADIRYAKINELTALEGEFEQLKADSITGGNLEVINGKIENLEVTIFDAETGDIKFANLDFSNIGEAAIESFLSKSGMVDNLIVGDGYVTGNLVGVKITGDLIEGETIKAENLILRGTDGLFYKLNTNGITTEAQQTDYNSLNGSVITAKSITAEKVNVKDLVAFDATIGGFKITDNSIYSGVKQSVDNTTHGIYMDNTGQMSLGDGRNFVKFFKDTNGEHKLLINASELYFGTSSRSVESAIDDIENTQIGTTNLIRNSTTLIYPDYGFGDAESIEFLTTEEDEIFIDNNENLYIY